MYRPGMDGPGVVSALTWPGWSWGGPSADLTGMDLGCLCTDLALMDLGWSVYRPGVDGAGVVCVLTWHGWIWGGLCADLAWMDLGWSLH